MKTRIIITYSSLAHIHTQIHTHIHTHTHTYIHPPFTQTYIHTPTTHTHIHSHTYTHTHTETHIYMYIYILQNYCNISSHMQSYHGNAVIPINNNRSTLLAPHNFGTLSPAPPSKISTPLQSETFYINRLISLIPLTLLRCC